ncbi:threonine/serine ThrE exporter family protein [Labedella endophytica]|uniref:Threonine/serine exporter family protein n=1 Tax=Labedella endophytica TaxID=1523160 RepID=A0A433JWH6_9MICO|nr:threonine/serine exporter family protein [Labedella endophytica]RUR03566.1 threonine/serine exporter family protein [Labedella endophytica]
MGLRTRWRRLAARSGTSSPRAGFGGRARQPHIAEQTIREVLELAVRIGEAMLALGAAASDVTDAIRRVCGTFGVECHIDLTFTAILVTHDGTDRLAGISVLRVVSSPTADYGRLGRVLAIERRLSHLPVDVQVADPTIDQGTRDEVREILESAHAELDETLSAPRPIRRWMVTLLLATLAGAVAVLLGGGPAIVAIAAGTTVLIDSVLRALSRWGLPVFFLQAVGAAVATIVAVSLSAAVPGLPVEFSTLPPALVVASGVVVLLAGGSVVGAANDAINGFPVTASGRIIEVVLLTVGIVAGIGGVLDLARRLGIALTLDDIPSNPAPFAAQVVAAGVASAAWAFASYAGPLTAALSGAAGAAAFAVFTATTSLGASNPAAAAVAATAVGFVSSLVSRRTGIPVVALTVCGIVPLLPGLTIYRGMLALVTGSTETDGGQLLLQAAMTGLSLAAGVTLGEILARRNRRRRLAGSLGSVPAGGTAVATDAAPIDFPRTGSIPMQTSSEASSSASESEPAIANPDEDPDEDPLGDALDEPDPFDDRRGRSDPIL